MLRAVHALVLEPENFDRDFAVYEGKTRRGKAWDAFQIEHEGRTILNTREHGEAETIAAAVLGYLPGPGGGPRGALMHATHPIIKNLPRKELADADPDTPANANPNSPANAAADVSVAAALATISLATEPL